MTADEQDKLDDVTRSQAEEIVMDDEDFDDEDEEEEEE